MEKLDGFEKARVLNGESTQLPKGGYIVKIMDCKEVKGNGYSYLAFSFDIAEGEYKGHFAGLYKESIDENKKWKGTYNVFVPQKDSQYYEDSLIRFKTMTSNFEDDNPGYHWDWDETKLKGKIIGIVYGEEEFKPDGRDEAIVITKPRYFTSSRRIKDNKYKIPQLKKLKVQNNDILSGFTEADIDDDLPF